MKCNKCGQDNSDEAAFCNKCGEKLGEISVKIQRGVKATQGTRQAVAPRATAQVRRNVSTPGMCFYHQQLPASYVCSRCGRSICKSCASFVGALAFCPHCRRY